MQTVEDSPARKAGLQKDDLIVSLDGEKIDSTEELIILIASKSPGKKISLQYQREDKLLSSKIKLGTRPSE